MTTRGEASESGDAAGPEAASGPKNAAQPGTTQPETATDPGADADPETATDPGAEAAAEAGAAADSGATIDRLIVNSPYEEPGRHWKYDRANQRFSLEEGRRPAGYVVSSGAAAGFDDPGVFREIPLVNRIRERVKEWRERGHPGVTGVTKRLLEHWTDPEDFDIRRFFFCQLEAVETLIWLTEAPANERVGIDIPDDGGGLRRLCAKMATGSGKTVVMAMAIAWQVLNKVASPTDTRFSKNVLIIAPGLTVRSRLAVLQPSGADNYYEEFRVIPPSLWDKLRRGKVVIRNWHALAWETAEQLARKRGVDKRGPKSDEAYVREVLGEMAGARNLLVINDEAHHAWRLPPGERGPRGVAKADVEEATKWVAGLDRIHRARGILSCLDFSATPFVPSGKQVTEESLFGWIVSDFGLNDAIESGLVKTPRVVIRDDALPDREAHKSRFYHIYQDEDVKADLNRPRAKPETPLPDLVTNAYYLLGWDWRETAQEWTKRGSPTPPVMITVANRTETAARIKHAFDHHHIKIEELCDPERTLRIDSKLLAKAEAAEEPIADPTHGGKLTQDQVRELLRLQVDTVGRVGAPGERIQNVISVGMLSEGWDAKTVTHIMGLRAFSSQLLCEQVVGRGLRRTSYEVNPDTGLFEAEYVNVFGVPFTFLPHEGREGPPPPVLPTTHVRPLPERKSAYAISWPNVVRIHHSYRPTLTLDMDEVDPLHLDAARTAQLAGLAPIVDGKPDVTKIDHIHLEGLGREFRTQRIIFEAAGQVYDQMQADWPGNREFLLAQVVRLVEEVMRSNVIRITPEAYRRDALKRRLVLTLNMTSIVQHIWEAIRHANAETLEPIFDQDQPIRSTADLRPWFTRKPCHHTERSHINVCVCDGTHETRDAQTLDRAEEVEAWVKNDHLGFEVHYVHRGIVRKYRPDFLVRLRSGTTLIVETKGKLHDADEVKRRYLEEWVRAVNGHGGFGHWDSAMARQPGQIHDILAKRAGD